MDIKQEDIKQEKAKKFAVRIYNLCKFLDSKNEKVFSKQILRSGTSIGANLAEAEFAQSREDFIHKISVSLKEVNETKYWLEVLNETKVISQEQFESISKDCLELKSILIKILLSLKEESAAFNV